jgi:hypothetical protein
MLKNRLNPLRVTRNYGEPNIEIIIAQIAMRHFRELAYYFGCLLDKVWLDTNGSQGAAKAKLARIKARSEPANHSFSHQFLQPAPQMLGWNCQSMGDGFVRPFAQRKIILNRLQYPAIQFIHSNRTFPLDPSGTSCYMAIYQEVAKM